MNYTVNRWVANCGGRSILLCFQVRYARIGNQIQLSCLNTKKYDTLNHISCLYVLTKLAHEELSGSYPSLYLFES
jgi:hypothetical protein